MHMHQQLNGSGELQITLHGEFDALGSQSIREALERLAQEPPAKQLVLDLKGVSFLDSSGVGAIVFLYKRLIARQCRLALSNVQGQPRELLQLLRVDMAIPVSWGEETLACVE